MADELLDVDRVVYDYSFAEDAYNEIPEGNQIAWLMTFLTMVADRFSNVQTEAVTLAKSRLLDNATGDMIDSIASRFFISRNGRDDDSLKALIKIQALKQDSEGTRDDIYNLLQALAGDEGFIKIFKGDNNYIEVVVSMECIEVSDITINLEGLFPINTNLKLLRVAETQTPFGFGSVNMDLGDYDKVAGFGSVTKTLYSDYGGVLPVTIVDDEVRGATD